MKTLTFLGALLISFSFFQLSAYASCGSIIKPLNSNQQNSSTIVIPIEDCNDPFGSTIDPPSPYTLFINEQLVEDGATILVPGGATNNIRFEGTPSQTEVFLSLYRHEGDDYRYVNIEPSVVGRSDFELALPTYFTTIESQQRYREILEYLLNDNIVPNRYFEDPDTSEKLIDPETGIPISERFYAFVDSVERNFVPVVPEIGEGTYTLIFRESTLIFSKNTESINRSFLTTLKEYLIPTVHAQCVYCIPEYIYTVTFTIVAAEEPEGASSVLFLPGIMGSRLYETGDICGDTGEIELWFSTSNCKQLRLKTRFDGFDLNDVYTKNTSSAVIDSVSILKLYASFIEEMDLLEQTNIIADFEPLAYDWRLRLDDLLKLKNDPQTGKVFYDPTINFNDSYLYETVEELAANSYSGKLTIVAHSNGGLLAKAFLERLESTNDPLREKIDNLILIAVPQAGTPDAIVGLLHGTGIGLFDSVVSQNTSREILNTAPFAHHLLPTNSYFLNANDLSTIISIEDGEITSSWQQQFGANINSLSALQDFLRQESGRTKPTTMDLRQPQVVDGFLLNYANTIHSALEAWEPADTTKVYQIAGVGIETPYQVNYYTGQECAERSVLQAFRCTRYESVLHYGVRLTNQGDGTVISHSALGMDEKDTNIKKLWLNLFEQNDKELINHLHKDIFEVPDIFNFVYNTILATTSKSYTYLTDSQPDFLEEPRLVITLHSPLDLFIINQNNGIVSSSTNTINGAVYRRFGEIQLISLPANNETITVKLSGVATGSFTLDTAIYEGIDLKKSQSYEAIPSSTSTIASLILTNGDIASGLVQVDYDGDSKIDISYNETGEIKDLVTYDTLLQAINKLSLQRNSQRKLLEVTARLAEFYYERLNNSSKFKKLELATLAILKKQVLLYERSKLINSSQKDELLSIINLLMKK